MRIAIVAPDDWTIWLFYRHLIGELQKHGAHVTAVTADGPHIDRLHSLGIDHIAVPYARFVEPTKDVELYRALRRVFSGGRFDIVQNITIKANLYGALAAANAGVGTIINTVEGSGLLYSDSLSPRVRVIRWIAERGLKLAKKKATRYWFVNERDRNVFVERGLAYGDRSVVAIATGVDTQQFDAASVSVDAIATLRRELGIESNIPIVANIAGRLLKSKGIAEFIDAARRLRASGVTAQFVLVGPEELENPDAFSADIVRAAVTAGDIRWIPFREDVWTVYAAASVAVNPTYYAEGTPKGVMEAMAMGRPVVASDIPSVRALVDDGRDGVLVAPASGEAIAAAVCLLLGEEKRRAWIGKAARETAVKRFDAYTAAQTAVDIVYGDLPAWQNRSV
jgi:glycosyltransferase involved in cell wall biosynthesis